MPFHHLAHFSDLEPTVKVGTLVKRGQVIGKVGNSGTTYAHSHYEIMIDRPENWGQYVWGMSKEEVSKRYINPDKYIDKEEQIPARFETYGGYMFLARINDKRLGYHPGVDINWGYGNQDLGSTVKAPCDGIVAFVDKDGNNGGWGTHIWIEEKANTSVADSTFGNLHAGKIFLAVGQRGRLYYVDLTGKKHDLGEDPNTIVNTLARLAQGINNEDLNKIP